MHMVALPYHDPEIQQYTREQKKKEKNWYYFIFVHLILATLHVALETSMRA